MIKFLRKNSFLLLIIAAGLSLVFVSAAVYYSATLYTPAKYEAEMIDQRNSIVAQIDKITTTLNKTDAEQEEIKAEINKLTAENQEFRTKIEKTKVPKNRNDLKQENEKYADLVDSYITAAETYSAALENDQEYNIKETIETYNASIDQITEQNQTIAAEVKSEN